MILLTTALYCEAKPLIEYFSLERDISFTHADIYRGEEIFLSVSGTGMVKGAAAAAFLLGRHYTCLKICAALNIGICGSVSLEAPIGQQVLMNKVVNVATERSFYPDILFMNTLLEGTVYSFPSPLYSSDIKAGTFRDGTEFADMEAAGFMEAAMAFLPPHRVQCMKIVSDHLEGKRLDPSFVVKLVENSLPHIDSLIKSMEKLCRNNPDILSEKEMEYIGQIAENLRLSVTMRYQLISLAEQYAVRTGTSVVTALSGFDTGTAGSKREGKIPFMDIRRILTGDCI